MFGVHCIYDRQGVERYVMFLQQARRPIDLVKRGLSAFAFAQLVVQVFWAVDAEAHVETVFFEELAPLVVQQHAVGLEIVFDVFCSRILLLKLHNLSKEIQAQ
jgi:hypothetical protein